MASATPARSLSPPPKTADGRDGRPVIHEELRRHYDSLYDQLLDGRAARDARPGLDVGSGDGLTLAAITQGTPLSGVAIDSDARADWLGPDGWDLVRADAQRLPFADGSFRTALMVDVFEWLRHPAVTLAECGRVTDGPILIVQTDWEGLWFQADHRAEVAERGREFVRAFTRGAPSDLRGQIRRSAAEAGLSAAEVSIASIRSNDLVQGSLAWDLLDSIRRYLVIESARVRARRFDEWRRELQRSADAGQFELLLRRMVAVVRRS